MSITTQPNNALVPQSLDQAARLAEMMSKGKLVPQHLHNAPGDCLMVIEQAMRWNMSPFAVAQCTSVIQGKLMFEGKLVAAAVQSSGLLASRLRYDYEGEGDQRQVTVSGVLIGETEPRAVVVKLKDARTGNKVWTTQPDQQLAYHGARVWSRRYLPEVMLGVYAPEEMDISPPVDNFTGTTIDAKAEPVEVKPQPTLYQRVALAVDKIQSWDATIANVEKAETLMRGLLNELDAAEMADEKDAVLRVLAEMRAAATAAPMGDAA